MCVTDKWQLVETAPKDVPLLVCFEDQSCEVARWTIDSDGHDLGWWTNDGLDFGYGSLVPTHWMPLPAPPPVSHASQNDEREQYYRECEQRSPMRFNINDNVKVRLREPGRQIHRAWIDDLNQTIKARGGKGFDYTPPREDADGWSTWQLWSLMQTFGPYMSLGLDPPFETWIELPEQS